MAKCARSDNRGKRKVMTIGHLIYIGLIGSCFMASRFVDGITKQRIVLLISFVIIGLIGLPTFLQERQQQQLIQKRKQEADVLFWQPFNKCIERRTKQISQGTTKDKLEKCVLPTLD
jgi:hypothetical protein